MLCHELQDLLLVMKDIRIMASVDSRRRRRIAKVSGKTLALIGMSTAGAMAASAAAEGPAEDGAPLLQGDLEIFAQVPVLYNAHENLVVFVT